MKIKKIIRKYDGSFTLVINIINYCYIKFIFFIFSFCRIRFTFKSKNHKSNSIESLIKKEPLKILKLYNERLYDIKNPLFNVDIKNIWEPRRFLKFSSLSLNNYSADIPNEIPSTSNAMEESISLINLIVGLQYNNFSNDNSLEIKKLLCFKSSYIMKNIEVGLKHSTNHYFFNLLGLLWLVDSLDKKPFLIKKFTESQLINYFKNSLNSDGSLFEGSSYYHKFVLESLLLYLYEFSLDNSKTLTFKKLSTISIKMYNFLENCRSGNKLINIGDNDSGRILPIPTLNNYINSELSLIDELVKKLDYQVTHKKSKKNDFGLFKLQNNKIEIFYRLHINKVRSKSLVTSHFHNDQNSIQFYYDGLPIITNLGTYSYVEDGGIRKEMRMTKRNSTVSIEPLEQNTITNDWNDQTINIGNLLDLNKKSIHGEFVYSKSIKHQRNIKISSRIIEINDKTKGVKSNLHSRGFLHFHPHINLNKISSQAIEIKFDKYFFKILSSSDFELIDSKYSKTYGKYEKSKSLAYSFSKQNKIVITLVHD